MKATLSTKDPLIGTIIGKMETDPSFRDNLEPGDYLGSFVIKVDYGIKVGEDYDAPAAQAVPWQRIAAYALSKLNKETRSAIINEALEGEVPELDEVGKAAQAAVARLTSRTTRPCKGKVTGVVSATVMSGVSETETRPVAGRTR